MGETSRAHMGALDYAPREAATSEYPVERRRIPGIYGSGSGSEVNQVNCISSALVTRRPKIELYLILQSIGGRRGKGFNEAGGYEQRRHTWDLTCTC